ncbi:hypothetical protein PVAP13_8KG399501 [Panicum virgatum]|uniref:Uncharacterized protein n=1 Tax=Panicum virgatum TaxID=38727 RepID=A0A8T0PPD9_PANVG|nr:hypothetical protein PVAP13_8KG399501 [Panicum virgatum]
MKTILQVFCDSSGQTPNFQKSSILFSRNVNNNTKVAIKNIFPVPDLQPHTKHLGHPIIFSHNDRNRAYNFIYGKFKGKLTTALHFPNVTFLSDSQQLVQALNSNSQENLPDWRAKPFTQIYRNSLPQINGKIFKILRSLNTTADTLARQASLHNSSHNVSFQPVCSFGMHNHQCDLFQALNHVNLQSFRLIAACCC